MVYVYNRIESNLFTMLITSHKHHLIDHQRHLIEMNLNLGEAFALALALERALPVSVFHIFSVCFICTQRLQISVCRIQLYDN